MGRTWRATTGRRLSPRCFLVLNRFEIFVSPLLIVFETSVSPFFNRDLCLSVWALSFPIRLYMPYSIKLGDTLVALFFVGGGTIPKVLYWYRLAFRIIICRLDGSRLCALCTFAPLLCDQVLIPEAPRQSFESLGVEENIVKEDSRNTLS